MHAGTLLSLAAALLVSGCAVTPAPFPGRLLDSSPHETRGSVLAQPLPVSPPRRRQGLREAPAQVGPGTVAGGQQNATQTRQAVLDAVDGVKDSTASSAGLLARLRARPPSFGNLGLSGVNGAFTRYLDFGSSQLPWLRGAQQSVTRLAEVTSELSDPEMELALLRMSGPRLQAAMSGALLLSAWLDFLQLADVVLREFPAYGVETLFRDLYRVRQRLEPTLAALASLEPERVEAAAVAMPELMGQLTREFGAIRDGARTAMERHEKLMAAMQLLETLTLVSSLRVALPRLPPAAPATLGVGLVMSPGGVMAGSQLVVSAEWVEMIRRLVRAGVLSVPAVSGAVRIHGGQVLMAQANSDLPKGVRDALGDGPEVRGMHPTGRAGAGMSDAPKHHVLPREHREWFEQRGFKGDMDIDQFCVRLEPAHHQAIHGGGNWRLGRTWPGEWNRLIMEALHKAEARAGRMLTRNAILKIVGENMKTYYIPADFTPWRGR